MVDYIGKDIEDTFLAILTISVRPSVRPLTFALKAYSSEASCPIPLKPSDNSLSKLLNDLDPIKKLGLQVKLCKIL